MCFHLSSSIKFQSYHAVLCLFAALLLTIFTSGCSQPPEKSKSFDPIACMENIPKAVKGLVVLEGMRTQESIIVDMQPVVCSAKVLFQKMREEGKKIRAGKVVFKVVVEFNGEVISATVAESTLHPQKFLSRVTGFILASDFRVWNRNDVDTVFLYPILFGE